MMTYTTIRVVTVDIKYLGEQFAIVADLRNPYVRLGIHQEWTHKFIKVKSNQRVHKKLENKLNRFGNFIICYTKITPDHNTILKLCGWPNATICVISGVGEHVMTP